jgi:hypothetical protein
MTTAQFNAFLEQLAQLHQGAGDAETAKSLRNLRELFDATSEQTVATFIKQLRVAITR